MIVGLNFNQKPVIVGLNINKIDELRISIKVEHISYTMGTCALPDICTLVLRLVCISTRVCGTLLERVDKVVCNLESQGQWEQALPTN